MNKIIILDDRVERKKQFLSEEDLDKLDEMSKKRDEDEGENEKVLKMQAKFPSNMDKFKALVEDCSIIAIHRTRLVESSLYNDVVEYTKNEHKYLIIFSGGIGQSLLLNGGQQLMINASNFYTKKLPKFIEQFGYGEIEYPLLQFLYGEQWRLPLLLQYRHALWMYDDKDIDLSEERLDQYQQIFKRNEILEFSIEDEFNWVNREINKENLNW